MAMTLRRTTALIVAVTLLGTAMGVYGFSTLVTDRTFSELEHSYAARDVDRARNAIANEISEIDTTVEDWASWDATYAYMRDRNRLYVEQNLPDDTLSALDLNYLVLIDLDGRPVVTRSIERESGNPVPISPDLFRELRLPINQQQGAADGYRRAGIVLLEDGPLMFAIRPVLTSEDHGPARGYLLMARYLDEPVLERLSEQTVLDLSLTTGAGTVVAGTMMTRVGDETLHASGALPTENEPGTIRVQVVIDRDIAREGTRVGWWMLAIAAGVTLIFGTAIFWLLERLVARRLRRLSRELSQIGSSGELGRRVAAEGRDEVGQLADGINRMLASLEQSAGRYEALVGSTPDAIYLVREGSIVYANPAGVAFVGAADEAELTGRPLETLAAQRDRAAIRSALTPSNQAAPARFEVTFAGPARRRVDLAFVPAGSDGLWQVSGRDVTELREREARERTFERRMQEAQRLESLGLLAGGIAHDFINILLAVAGNAAIAKLEVDSKSPAAESITEIETAAFRAADLTRQLLAYAGNGQLMIQQVDVADLVRDTVKLVRRVAGSFVVVDIDASDRPVFIEGDEVQLRQVVMNLVTNAFDALGDRPGHMRVSSGARAFDAAELSLIRSGVITASGHYAFISVSDDGPGIPPDTINRVFEPFYSTKGPGRGLGLAAVIGIVNAHRGAIIVESNEDHGTTFTVLFPEAAAVSSGAATASVRR
ncbi:MAG: HAMP domain-containing protein [Chloroflexi bacterium]|nr:HAMP domain-containing protein [Chloroflexota bacterium]